jgi:hypothetical protein
MVKVIGGLRVKKGSGLSYTRKLGKEKQAEAEQRGERASREVEMSKRRHSPGMKAKPGHGFEAVSKGYQKQQAEHALAVDEKRRSQGRPGLRPHQLRLARRKAGL